MIDGGKEWQKKKKESEINCSADMRDIIFYKALLFQVIPFAQQPTYNLFPFPKKAPNLLKTSAPSLPFGEPLAHKTNIVFI
jgi:hypothetical protein